MDVKIESIDVIAEEDVYRRGGEYTTYTQLYINPGQRRVVVSQQSDAPGVGTPEGEWHKRELTYDIGGGRWYGRGEPKPAPDGDALRAFLESDESQDMLCRICDGHDIEWNGHDRVGRLDEDAQGAEAKLLEAIDDLPENEIVTWTVDEWLGNCTPDDLGLRKLMSYRQIRKLADGTVEQAAGENVHLDGDVYEYLAERQKEMRR